MLIATGAIMTKQILYILHLSATSHAITLSGDINNILWQIFTPAMVEPPIMAVVFRWINMMY